MNARRLRSITPFFLFLLLVLPTHAQTESGWERHVLHEGYHIQNVDIVDLDLDGDMDLLYADEQDALLIRQTAPLEFETDVLDLGIDYWIEELIACDMDLDGDHDLLISDAAPGGDLEWLEDDNGVWVHHIIHPNSSARRIYPGDVDGDGDVDVIFTNLAQGAVLCLNEGGIWIEVPLPVPPGLSDAAAADINDDSDMELLYYTFTLGTISLLDYTANGWETLAQLPANTPEEILPVDWNGDGMLDAVTRDGWYDPSANWQLNAFDLPETVAGMAVGDLNEDGQLDLAVGYDGATPMQWYQRDGQSLNARPMTDDVQNAEIVRVVDLDGDGVLEIVAPSLYPYGVESEPMYHGALLLYSNDLERGLPWVSITPAMLWYYGGPIVFGAEGGELEFEAWFHSPLQQPQVVTAWTRIVTPGGTVVGPLAQQPLVLQPDQSRDIPGYFVQAIPAMAPPGEYEFQLVVGQYPGLIADIDRLTVVKQAGNGPTVSASGDAVWPATTIRR